MTSHFLIDRLGYRLFVHPKFLDMMRLHSKTVFKLNAAFLLFLILSMFVIILNVASVSSIYPRQDNITDLTNTTNQVRKIASNTTL